MMPVRKLLIALFIVAVLTVAFLGSSFAAPRNERLLRPRQSGLYMWSTETRQFLKIDHIVAGVQKAQNELSRQVFSLEQRIKALEQD